METDFNLNDFAELCKNLTWKWEQIEDETAREVEKEKFEAMMSYYQSLRLSLADETNSNNLDARELKKIENVYLRYAPEGYMP